MWSPLMSSQGPSLRCLAPETAKGAADTASARAAEAQRRTSEAGEFGAVLAPRPRGGRLVRPGKFFRRRGWRRCLRDLARLERHAGTGLRNAKGADHLAHAPNTPPKPRQAADRCSVTSCHELWQPTRPEPISNPTNRGPSAVSPAVHRDGGRIKRRDTPSPSIAGRGRRAKFAHRSAARPSTSAPPSEPALGPARQLTAKAKSLTQKWKANARLRSANQIMNRPSREPAATTRMRRNRPLLGSEAANWRDRSTRARLFSPPSRFRHRRVAIDLFALC